MYDYQGRSYLHVPQDVGINLRSAEAPDKCYLPKKQIHVWSGHTKVSRKGHVYHLCFFKYINVALHTSQKMMLCRSKNLSKNLLGI